MRFLLEGREAGKVPPLSRRRLEVRRPVCTDSVPADFLEHAFLIEVAAPSTLSDCQGEETNIYLQEGGRRSKAFF